MNLPLCSDDNRLTDWSKKFYDGSIRWDSRGYTDESGVYRSWDDESARPPTPMPYFSPKSEYGGEATNGEELMRSGTVDDRHACTQQPSPESSESSNGIEKKGGVSMNEIALDAGNMLPQTPGANGGDAIKVTTGAVSVPTWTVLEGAVLGGAILDGPVLQCAVFNGTICNGDRSDGTKTFEDVTTNKCLVNTSSNPLDGTSSCDRNATDLEEDFRRNKVPNDIDINRLYTNGARLRGGADAPSPSEPTPLSEKGRVMICSKTQTAQAEGRVKVDNETSCPVSRPDASDAEVGIEWTLETPAKMQTVCSEAVSGTPKAAPKSNGEPGSLGEDDKEENEANDARTEPVETSEGDAGVQEAPTEDEGVDFNKNTQSKRGSLSGDMENSFDQAPGRATGTPSAPQQPLSPLPSSHMYDRSPESPRERDKRAPSQQRKEAGKAVLGLLAEAVERRKTMANFGKMVATEEGVQEKKGAGEPAYVARSPFSDISSITDLSDPPSDLSDTPSDIRDVRIFTESLSNGLADVKTAESSDRMTGKETGANNLQATSDHLGPSPKVLRTRKATNSARKVAMKVGHGEPHSVKGGAVEAEQTAHKPSSAGTQHKHERKTKRAPAKQKSTTTRKISATTPTPRSRTGQGKGKGKTPYTATLTISTKRKGSNSDKEFEEPQSKRRRPGEKNDRPLLRRSTRNMK